MGKVLLNSMEALRRHENSMTFSQHHLPTLGEEGRGWDLQREHLVGQQQPLD